MRWLIFCTLIFATMTTTAEEPERPRAREIGVHPGILPPGPLNAITDVEGVLVGNVTRIEGDDIRTGVTAVLPHAGNLFREKVPGAVFVGNGFGKLVGATQVRELGQIETPIVLTSTLSVFRVADALVSWMLEQLDNEDAGSINPLVGETNDGRLNDIRGRHVGREEVFQALENASGGAVEEGAVGAGTGTVAFGFKGGIGTSSRRLPSTMGGWTVGVLVQTNFGGVLTIAGAPVGRELGRYILKDELDAAASGELDPGDGSIMIVIATEAPVGPRNLERMAGRSMMGLARTGAAGTNGSGDYAIAFSTHPRLRMRHGETEMREIPDLPNDAMTSLFLAVIEATEEAIYNSLFRAETMSGRGVTVPALPLEETIGILKRHGVIGYRQ
jgi:D-aminopeptidase